MNLDWLNRFVNPQPRDKIAWSGHVNYCDGWAIATDSRTLVAVRDKTAVGTCRPVVKTYLGRLPDPAFTTTLRALWLWCGKVTMETCPRCRGTGYLDPQTHHYRVCDDCDGEATWLHDGEEAVQVAGVWVESSRLAWSLAPELEPGPVKAGRVFHIPELISSNALYLDGPNWRVVISGVDMAVRQSRPELARASRAIPFHSEPLFAELWAQREWDVLADWLEEKGDSASAEMVRQMGTAGVTR